MKISLVRKRLVAVDLFSIVNAIFVGILINEAWCFGTLAAKPIYSYVSNNCLEELYAAVSCITLMLIVWYMYCRGVLKWLILVVKSMCIDLLAVFIMGIYLSIIFNGFGFNFYAMIISKITACQLILLISMLVFIGTVWVVRFSIVSSPESNKLPVPYFIVDEEMKSADEDLLGMADFAERFAERVYNAGTSDSLVFGVDAPWGMGKSSFVNFCQEYWKKKYVNKIIVYKFNPLRYVADSNLLEKFIDGLVCEIQKNMFIPELRSLVSRYSSFLAAKKKVSFLGLDLEFVSSAHTIDDVFNDLEVALSGLNQKVIIIVDDLDRLPLSAIKDVLFTIKKSFTLPNLSYVLCYDTENIVDLSKNDVDADKIIEFLEKFINIKICLFLDSNVLIDYVSKNIEKSLVGNFQADPVLVSKAMAGLISIYKSSEYHNYVRFIGDIRKVKRLLNTIVLLDIEKVNFDHSDLNQEDLIHLLIIYINYPNIFRKIYTSEVAGSRGFFSVVEKYDSGYPGEDDDNDSGLRNSTFYCNYLKSLSDDQRFLLNQVFNVSIRLRAEGALDASLSEEVRNTYACFNGVLGGGRNLEAYLDLIAKLSKPLRVNQYRFYQDAIVKLKSGASVKEILKGKEFLSFESVGSHKLFWRAVTNSAHEIRSDTGTLVINYLLENIPQYSYLKSDELDVGFRDDLVLYLVRLLDRISWSEEDDIKNTPNDNLLEIGRWIFGDAEGLFKGVLASLSVPNRGVLGLFDLMIFRLYCCVNRGGNMFNLCRALSLRSSPDAPTTGALDMIVKDEMRDISQEVFRIFKRNYISSSENIFDCVDALSLEDLTGMWNGYVKAKVEQKIVPQVQINKNMDEVKSRSLSFIIYQLGNTTIDSGIGCGYYDEEGGDDGCGIASAINEYLFNICFNAKLGENNYVHFIDYLLRNYATPFHTGKDRPIPRTDSFLKVLDSAMLKKYWSENRVEIKERNFMVEDKVITTGGHTLSYNKNLNELFDFMDEFIRENNEDIRK